MEHGQAACSNLSRGNGSLRAAGRVPGGGGISARRPTFVSCSSTSPALAVLCPREEWCLYTAKAICTDSFSWRAHPPGSRSLMADRSRHKQKKRGPHTGVVVSLVLRCSGGGGGGVGGVCCGGLTESSPFVFVTHGPCWTTRLTWL